MAELAGGPGRRGAGGDPESAAGERSPVGRHGPRPQRDRRRRRQLHLPARSRRSRHPGASGPRGRAGGRGRAARRDQDHGDQSGRPRAGHARPAADSVGRRPRRRRTVPAEQPNLGRILAVSSGKGGVGQVDRRREPGGRPGAGRRPGRRDGRRHLRAEHPAHVRRLREAAGRRAARSSRSRPTA